MEKKKHMDESVIDRLRKRYQNHLEGKEKGIFTQRVRQQLVGERPKYENTFWYRIRNDVRLSLIDLALFVETASKNDVDKIITAEALEPFANSFFYIAFPDQASPERARVGALFIRKGLEYLSRANSKHMTLPNQTAVRSAESLVDYFVANIERGEHR